MQEYTTLQKAIHDAYRQLDIDALEQQRQELQQQMAAADFWNDQQAAQETSKTYAVLEKRTTFWNDIKTRIDDVVELAGLNDDSLQADIDNQAADIQQQFDKAKLELQFTGKYDDNDVVVSLFAGAGGDDAQDWTQMLLRMYSRWAEQHDCQLQLLDQSSGEVAGIKSATFTVSGVPFLYGKFQAEHGVHRLVRLSPFNADSLRQTSFARVEVVPKISSPTDVEIDEKDLKIDVYRSGGKGGQSVNTTDSAVRVTHIPTNIVVAIQNERSQLQNKETAMTILRSKLAKLQIEQHKQHVSELTGPTTEAAWGNQIRNYVMHPYSMVKDTRTKHETTDVQAVLDGAIDEFIVSYLDAQM